MFLFTFSRWNNNLNYTTISVIKLDYIRDSHTGRGCNWNRTWPHYLGGLEFIVRGVANGLSFLHSSDKPIIAHQDMKSHNVFLDSDFQLILLISVSKAD